jgi:hypothetical protein
LFKSIKMKYSFIKLAVFALAFLVSFSGCNKDEDEDNNETPEYDTNSMQDNALAENTWNDIGSISDQAADGSDSVSSYRPADGNSILGSGCATVTLVTGSPNIITVDFGANWCQCLDGRYRKGKFTISYTGAYSDSGTVITQSASSSDNYYVKFRTDTNKIMKVVGTRTVKNLGRNSNGKPMFEINVNGTFTDQANRTMTWTSHRFREWTTGDSTQYNWIDDQYTITGDPNGHDASGTSFDAVNFTVEIDVPLFVDFTCYQVDPRSCKITKGKITLTPAGKPARSIDFGSGLCDNLATFIVRDRSWDIDIR